MKLFSTCSTPSVSILLSTLTFQTYVFLIYEKANFLQKHNINYKISLWKWQKSVILEENKNFNALKILVKKIWKVKVNSEIGTEGVQIYSPLFCSLIVHPHTSLDEDVEPITFHLFFYCYSNYENDESYMPIQWDVGVCNWWTK